MAKISQPIDRLTNSIVNIVTGDSFDTEINEVKKSELKNLQKGWKFNWYDEFSKGTIYKLTKKKI